MSTDRTPYQRVIEELALAGKPRLFTVFGTAHHLEGTPLIGWGIELQHGGGALFRYSGQRSIHSSDTAERLLRVQRRLGDVELRWLDN
ncbi:hypothetical protein [Amycolatopsis sp. NPDC051102]|uniref:hypothetical protein n=1 Tax=Amycolatopsis sp. NPDC051102 TaxID=3155163 RepID=UPI0034345760